MLSFEKLIFVFLTLFVVFENVVCDRKTDMKKLMVEYNTAIMKEWNKVDKVCRDQSGFNFTVDNQLTLIDQIKKGSESAICFGECALIEFGVINEESDINPTKLLKMIPDTWRNGDFKDKIDLLMDKCDIKNDNTSEKSCALGSTTVNCVTTFSEIIETMPIANITKFIQGMINLTKE